MTGVRCGCGTEIVIREEDGARSVPCPRCRKQVAVPTSELAPAVDPNAPVSAAASASAPGEPAPFAVSGRSSARSTSGEAVSAPAPVAAVAAVPSSNARIFVVLLGILLLVFGIVGLFSGPAAFEAALHPRRDLTPGESLSILKLCHTEDAVRYALIATSTVSFLLSLVQTVASIGVLRRSEWGRVLTIRCAWCQLAQGLAMVATMWVILYPKLSAPPAAVDPAVRAAARATLGAYTVCILPCVPAWCALPLIVLSRRSVRAQFS